MYGQPAPRIAKPPARRLLGHNWPDYPLEVLELKLVIDRLDP
jgi:hypothetical protein